MPHGLENATHFLLKECKFCKCENYNRIERKEEDGEMDEKTILRKVKNSNGIYTCDELDITVDEWKKVLQDKSITNNYKLWLARFYQEDKHKATCKYMGDKYKCHPNAANATIKNFAEITQKILNRFEVQGTDGKPTYWVIPMKKGIEIKDLFEWTMRDELVQAMEELDMTNPEDFEENLDIGKIQLLIKHYKRLIDSDLETAFTSEEYKWEIIKWCENKSDVEIYQYLVDEKPNLFDKFSVAQAGKDIVEESKINELLGQLYDENKELNERLSDFKKYMENKSDPTKKRILKDERAASVFLTCKYPDKYTFYKDSYYGKLCDFLSVPKKTAGEKYSHFLELISEIEKVIKTDTELLSKMDNLTKNYSRNTKLIAQNMTYVLFDRINILSENQGDTQMPQEDTLVNKYANLLKNTKNLILTGAPGTGKTYLAKTIAARLILDREINDFDKELSEEEKKQVESQTGFVQFHPSYDYTDFVEGLRPKQSDNSDQIGFERKDGVFKDFCARALKESYRENNENVDNFEECWERLVEELNENNYIDISLLSGKGNLRVELNEYGTGLANRTYENDDYQEGNWISGKSKFFSKDQLYNIYQGLPGVPAGGHDNYRKAIVEYMKKNLGLLDYKKTESTQKTKKNFVFIIDEINRGEVAKIFGELFYCVDPGYRGEKGRISTQYQNLVTCGEFQKGFFIPENVYIIGTMNDIDRSVESMDFAFRRRFTWAEVKAEDTQYMLDAELDAVLADEAKRRMENLNSAISEIEGLNEAYHIGASYFLKLKNYDGNFECLWEYHIKGILQEYLRGNPDGKLDDLKAAYDREEEKKDGE